MERIRRKMAEKSRRHELSNFQENRKKAVFGEFCVSAKDESFSLKFWLQRLSDTGYRMDIVKMQSGIFTCYMYSRWADGGSLKVLSTKVLLGLNYGPMRPRPLQFS